MSLAQQDDLSPALTTSAIMDTSNRAAATSRKRRRRVPASGAADDCFACRKRNMKCDRRRPYCSQCLEQGKDCSGYKTQLTWGVGVASRGKLRGQALPVLKKTKPPALSSQRARRSFSSTTESSVLSHASSQASPEGTRILSPDMTPSPTVGTGFDQANLASTSSEATIRQSPIAYQSPVANRWVEDRGQTLYAQRRPLEALLHLHVPLAGSVEDYAQPKSASSISTFSESDLSSSSHFPPAFDEASCLFSPVSPYDTLPYQPGTAIGVPFAQVDQRAPTSYPEHYLPWVDESLSSSVSSITSSDLGSMDGLFSFDGCHNLPPSPLDPCISAGVLLEDNTSGMRIPSADGLELGFGWESRVEHTAPDLQADDTLMCSTATESSLEMLSLPRTLHFSSVSDASSRMRYLIHYYDRVICPALVVWDSASNPFRCQMLPLAQSSDCLLYAIGALSASSLRGREAVSTRSGSHLQGGHRVGSGESDNDPLFLDDGDANKFNFRGGKPAISRSDSSYREELHLKELSVQHLNRRLCDPSQASQDPVLATLLILCLFHACQTGIESFDIQLAGIRKLLHLRRKQAEAETPSWMMAVFACIDAMIATINDREPRLQELWVDVTGNPECKSTLEMVTGCEVELLNVIASLGQLNSLSNDRSRGLLKPSSLFSSSLPSRTSALASASDLASASASFSATSGRLAGQATRDYYSLQDIAHDNKGRSYLSLNEIPNTCNTPASQMNRTRDEHDRDATKEFSRECQLLRHRLEEWNPSDVSHSADLSLSFRYAALLYIERLTAPAGLPSKHARIQRLVSKIISHTSKQPTSTNSIFNCWPLFIAGTECVDRRQRSFIRKRCRELYRRSGFINGMVSLRIQRKVWRRLDDEDEFDDDDDDGNDVEYYHDAGDRGTLLHGSLASANMVAKGGCVETSPFKWRKHLNLEGQGEYFVV
ncbi:MAG: hypothetical protein M1816_001247 [Peltula sp. TS41687]|nr:MAG: hypothetical protein M1816_001247 [Peltula sp. TS41687]